MAGSDPGIIGRHTGLPLMVIQHMMTTKAELQAAQKTLAGSGLRLSGAILNQFDQARSRYGGCGSKHGYYYGGHRYRYD